MIDAFIFDNPALYIAYAICAVIQVIVTIRATNFKFSSVVAEPYPTSVVMHEPLSFSCSSASVHLWD